MAFHQTCWKEGEKNMNQKGKLGSLHKISFCRHSLTIKPAYKALLGCTCASGRMYTSGNCRGGKKRYFLNEGNSLNMLGKGRGSQKISDCPLRTKYFEKEKGLVYCLKLNSGEKKRGGWVVNTREKQNQCHCYINHFKFGW